MDLSSLSDQQLEVYRDLLAKKQQAAVSSQPVPGTEKTGLPKAGPATIPAGLQGPPQSYWQRTAQALPYSIMRLPEKVQLPGMTLGKGGVNPGRDTPVGQPSDNRSMFREYLDTIEEIPERAMAFIDDPVTPIKNSFENDPAGTIFVIGQILTGAYKGYTSPAIRAAVKKAWPTIKSVATKSGKAAEVASAAEAATTTSAEVSGKASGAVESSLADIVGKLPKVPKVIRALSHGVPGGRYVRVLAALQDEYGQQLEKIPKLTRTELLHNLAYEAYEDVHGSPPKGLAKLDAIKKMDDYLKTGKYEAPLTPEEVIKQKETVAEDTAKADEAIRQRQAAIARQKELAEQRFRKREREAAAAERAQKKATAEANKQPPDTQVHKETRATPSPVAPVEPLPSPPKAAPSGKPQEIAAKLQTELEKDVEQPAKTKPSMTKEAYAAGAREQRVDNASKLADALAEEHKDLDSLVLAHSKDPTVFQKAAQRQGIPWPKTEEAQSKLVHDAVEELKTRKRVARVRAKPSPKNALKAPKKDIVHSEWFRKGQEQDEMERYTYED